MDKHLSMILLVEDDEEDQWLVKRSFAKSKCITLNIVGNGQEALDYLRDDSQPNPDLILLDINMPVMDGPTFMSEFKADKNLPNPPIIILTTSDQEEHVEQAYELGAAAYMVKPPNFDGFKAIAESLENFWCTCVSLPQRIRRG